jgi:NAD(P)-dependent dehydrogenase (short-subunit alcohol dehydrogenase family)
MKLDHSSALVLGASGVLGAGIARELRLAGASLSLVTRSGELADDLRGEPHVRADLRDGAGLKTALDQLSPPFDIVVNATGVVAFGRLDEVPEEVVRELFDTNALGVINLLRYLSTRVNEGGAVVNLTGVAADVSVLGLSAYGASKAAAKAALAVAAREWRGRKIRVLDVRAPHTETGLVTRALWGTAPSFGVGLDPAIVSRRVIEALAADETVLTPESFTSP